MHAFDKPRPKLSNGREKEEEKKRKFARGDERDVGWLCVNVG